MYQLDFPEGLSKRVKQSGGRGVGRISAFGSTTYNFNKKKNNYKKIS